MATKRETTKGTKITKERRSGIRSSWQTLSKPSDIQQAVAQVDARGGQRVDLCRRRHELEGLAHQAGLSRVSRPASCLGRGRKVRGAGWTVLGSHSVRHRRPARADGRVGLGDDQRADDRRIRARNGRLSQAGERGTRRPGGHRSRHAKPVGRVRPHHGDDAGGQRTDGLPFRRTPGDARALLCRPTLGVRHRRHDLGFAQSPLGQRL